MPGTYLQGAGRHGSCHQEAPTQGGDGQAVVPDSREGDEHETSLLMVPAIWVELCVWAPAAHGSHGSLLNHCRSAPAPSPGPIPAGATRRSRA